jgi:hypothetical protein
MCSGTALQSDLAAAQLTTFHVTGLPEPATIARVVEVFALRSLLPRTLSCETLGDELRIAVTLGPVETEEAERLAERLRQIVIVDQVLLELRPS